MSSTSSQTTIDMLRVSFSNHGLPEMIVSDNATSFTSEHFAEFCEKNGIYHVTSAPFHPASNGLAERAVQTFKSGFDKMGKEVSRRNWLVSCCNIATHHKERLANLLLNY